MAASEGHSANGVGENASSLRHWETDNGFLEVPEHMKHTSSSCSLAASENSGRDGDSDRTDMAILESCVEEVTFVPVHLQELITENILPSSPVAYEKDVLLTPTSPRASHSAEEQRTPLQKYLLWGRLSGPFLAFTLIGVVLIVLARSHLTQLLNLLENLPWFESFVVFMLLFTLVSFPFGFGYVILNMMAGYLYGFARGQLVVMVSVTIGFTISFFLCRIWFRDYAKHIVTSNALQAIMRVVEGKNGVKVILLTRLTPIPFGLQNVLFSVSVCAYHIDSVT